MNKLKYRVIFLMLMKINRNLKLSYTVLAMQVGKHMEQLFIRDV